MYFQIDAATTGFGAHASLDPSDTDYNELLFVKLQQPLPSGSSVAKSGTMTLMSGPSTLLYKMGSREYKVTLSIPDDCGASRGSRLVPDIQHLPTTP